MGKKKQNPVKETSSTQGKKAEVLGGGDSIKGKLIACAVLVAALVAGGVYWMEGSSGGGATAMAQNGSVTQTSDAVFHAVADFSDGRARHFALKTPGGTEVRYFVLKSSDGVIRAAFDACDVCWRSNKGYTQDGDVMVCNNCGRRFPSVSVNEVQGGCNPAPLVRTIQGDKLIIAKADIYAGARYFTF